LASMVAPLLVRPAVLRVDQNQLKVRNQPIT
jgi:hypothetical protein